MPCYEINSKTYNLVNKIPDIFVFKLFISAVTSFIFTFTGSEGTKL